MVMQNDGNLILHAPQALFGTPAPGDCRLHCDRGWIATTS